MDSQNDFACPQSEQGRNQQIRQLNDAMRKGKATGQMFLTQGIIGLGQGAVAELLKLVHDFEDFSENNDPYGEHDFGAMMFHGERVFWKIDYYDNSLRFGSEDPANAAVTTRVMTIMLAREY